METECEFCSIVHGKQDGKIVFSDEVSLAFLDSKPIFPGHCLLIPKEHFVTVMETPDELLEKLSLNAKMLSIAVQKTMKSDGILVLSNNVISQSVPHLHIHVIPRKKGDGLKGFLWPRHDYESAAQAEWVADSIRNLMRLPT